MQSDLHRLLPWLTGVLVAAGCAATGPNGADDIGRTPRAEQNLRRLAEREVTSAPVPRPLVPVPPGMEDAVLAPRPAEDVSARLSADLALHHLVPTAPAASVAAQPRPASVDDATRDQALWHYAKGRDAALRNRHLVAITELERAHTLDPTSTLIIRQLARSYSAMGNDTRAANYFERLLDIEPDDDESMFLLGLAATNRRDFRRAVSFLARPRLAGTTFDHDPAADCLADFMLGTAVRELGYDRAWIELATGAVAKLTRLSGPTNYRFRYESLYRRRSEIWRSMGDAHCRLLEYDEALAAYRVSAGLPNADPGMLHPRVIFANLALGRTWTAQLALLEAIDDDRGASEQDIRLCLYLSGQLGDLDRLADALVEKHRVRPQDATLVRAAATLLPRQDAVRLLRAFLHRRPEDLDVLGHLLGWLVDRDEPSAAGLTVALAQDHPDLGAAYGDELAKVSRSPQALIDAVRTLPVSAARVVVLNRLLVYVGALGPAWSECVAGVQRWPDDRSLRVQQVFLAALLEEPQLLQAVLADAEEFDDAPMWLARSRAHRALGETEDALAAATRAVEILPGSPVMIVALAEAHATHAEQLQDLDGRRQHAENAARAARRAIDLDPTLDDAYAILLGLYAPNSVLADRAELLAVRGRLARDNAAGALSSQLDARDDLVQGRAESALKRLRVICEADPADRATLELAVAVWAQARQLDQAQEYLEDRLAQRPADPVLLEQWVAVLIQTGQTDMARERLAELLERETSHDTARQLLETIARRDGRHAVAVALAETRLLSRPREMHRAQELATLYAGAERFDQAGAELDWILERADVARFDQLVNALGVAGHMSDRDERFSPLVLSFAQRTVTRFPEAPLMVYGSGLRALARIGPIDERFDDLADRAVHFARGAAGQTRQEANIWRLLAQKLVDAGYPEAAGRAVRTRLLADAPLEPRAWSMLAIVTLVSNAASGDAEAAVDLVKALALRGRLPRLVEVSREPPIGEIYYEASQIFGTLGDEHGAERLLLETVRHQPDHAMALNNLGYTRLELGRADRETVRYIERAHVLVPDDSNVLDTVGWLRYKSGLFKTDGDADGAIGLIRRSIEKSGEPSAEVLDHLGDTLWRLGDAEAATDAWRRAVEMLQDTQRREQIQQVYLLQQERWWGLIVASPEEMYDRQFGDLLNRARMKLQDADAGGTPAVASTFEEMGVSGHIEEVGNGGP